MICNENCEFYDWETASCGAVDNAKIDAALKEVCPLEKIAEEELHKCFDSSFVKAEVEGGDFCGKEPNVSALQKLSEMRGHCGEIHRLSPPVKIENELVSAKDESVFCRVQFPATVYIKNESIRNHMAALIAGADCVTIEETTSGIRFSFRVDGVWLNKE